MISLADNTATYEGKVGAVVENRYGIIHTLVPADGDDIAVFGGNVYDGRINVDFVKDSNGISRVYALAAVAPHARRILNVGMSAGPWTRVLSAFPDVERIDVVEINPGYAEVARNFPQTSPVLSDPRIYIHYDDGRRWLKRNPTERYDLIVMNTTYHWRGYAALLLSRDFIAQVKQHMSPGAILAYNTTGSGDVLKTAASVFPSVYRFQSFAIAGDDVQVPDADVAVARMAGLTLDGQPLVDLTRPADREKAYDVAGRFEPFDAIENSYGRELQVITDQNMLSEYKYGRSILRYLGHR